MARFVVKNGHLKDTMCYCNDDLVMCSKYRHQFRFSFLPQVGGSMWLLREKESFYFDLLWLLHLNSYPGSWHDNLHDSSQLLRTGRDNCWLLKWSKLSARLEVLRWNPTCLCNKKIWTNRLSKAISIWYCIYNPWPHCAFLFFSFQVLPFVFFELQSRWIAMALSGRVELPSVAEMLQSVEAYYAKLEASGKTKRSAHTVFAFQVKPGPLLPNNLKLLMV